MASKCLFHFLSRFQVRDQIAEAVKLVEVFLQSTRSVVVVPNLVSLGQLSETPATLKPEENGAKSGAPSILLRWELGTQVPVEELVCQAAYDLGVYYFHMGDYEKAGFLLQTCGNLFSQVRVVYVNIACLVVER